MTSNRSNYIIQFINFGKNREANAHVDYAVQVVAKGHEFREGDNVVFNVNNLGGLQAQNLQSKIAELTTRSF